MKTCVTWKPVHKYSQQLYLKIAQIGKNLHVLSTIEWINKPVHLLVKNYSFRNTREATWMNLKTLLQCERSQPHMHVSCMIQFMNRSGRGKIICNRKDQQLAEVRVRAGSDCKGSTWENFYGVGQITQISDI